MYKFQSGDRDNSKFINFIQKSQNDRNREKFEEIRRNADLTSISYLIFKDLARNFDEANYNTICISLTLADELIIPIQKSICDILYFATCVNSNKEIDMTINNLSQARIIYELYNNDYLKIKEDCDSSGKRFSMSTLEASHKNILFPGYKITWKIPVGFYRVEDENNPGKMIQKCTLSGLGYCEVIINGDSYKIPRIYFIKFCIINRNILNYKKSKYYSNNNINSAFFIYFVYSY